MFGTPGGKVAHRYARCAGREFAPLNARGSRAWCRRCVAECIICGDVHRVDTCHALCDTCRPLQRDVFSQDPAWNGIVVCPCGSGDVLHAAPPPPRRAALMDTLDRVATAHCPWCDAPYIDFDGCCAIQCRCGNFFCGLCWKRCATSAECHAHVSNCPRNPRPPELFLRHDEIERATLVLRAEYAWSEIWRARWDPYRMLLLVHHSWTSGIPLVYVARVPFLVIAMFALAVKELV